MSEFDDLVKLLDSNEVFIDDKNSDMFKLSTLLKDVFKAGAQSKQAEIDELRKRIDDLDKQLFVQKGLNIFLKGKSNDN